MADFEKDDLDEMEDDVVVVITDEDGNESYYREEMIIPVGEKKFAILVPIDTDDCDCSDNDPDHNCECCGDEGDALIARIDTDENGEEIYIDPTDEEYDAVLRAYEELLDEEE